MKKCRNAGIPQLTFTGGEPTLRHDLVKLVQAHNGCYPALNTNGRMLTSMMCKDLHAASLDAVQITFYSADADIHNALVGVDGYTDTVNGIKNALAADLNVSLNTPLCSLNRDYLSVVRFAHELGIRYLTCSGLIPAGNAESDASRAVRLTPAELEDVLRPAMEYAAANGMEINFTSPGWLPEDGAAHAGLYPNPQLRRLSVQHGRGAGRHGAALPELADRQGTGQYAAHPLAAHLAQRCLPRHPRRERQNGAPLPAGGHPDAGGLLMKMNFLRRLALLCAVLTCGMLLALPAAAAEADAPYAEDGDMDYIRSYVVTVDPREDGSVDITYDIDWQVIDGDKTDYLSWVKIGLANSSVDELTPLTDTISDLQYTSDGGSYAKVVFRHRYYAPDVAAANGGESSVHFAFSVHQSHLFTKNDDGTANFAFVPGWFDDLSS